MATCAPEFTIHVDAVAPYSLEWTVTASPIDLSSTSAVFFRVWRQASTGGGDYDEWSAQTFTANVDSCTAEYAYQAGDLPIRERLVVSMRMVTTAGSVFATPKNGLVDELRNQATCVPI